MKGFSGKMMGILIAFLLVSVLLGSLLPEVTDLFNWNASATNVTGATSTVAGLMPLILLIVVVVVILGAIGIKFGK